MEITIININGQVGRNERIGPGEYVQRFIRQLSSPFAAPVQFAKKQDSRLLFCINYRDINNKTIKNRDPIPLSKETQNVLGKARIYTKLDVLGLITYSASRKEMNICWLFE